MTRARRITVGGVAIAVAALVASGSGALPVAAGPPTQWIDAGTLTLTTGSTDAVVFNNGTPAPADDVTQTLGNVPTTSCDLTTSGALVGFTGRAGTVSKPVGFLNDSIGVNERLRELCYKVDTITTAGPETLDLKLGPKLVNFADIPLLATAANLDLEVSSYLGAKAKVQATAWLDRVDSAGQASSEQVGSTVELLQGSGSCTVKDYDNCRLNVAPGSRFNRLSLKVVKGSFSLEGGSDTQAGAKLAPSTFMLASQVDSLFSCTEGQTLTEGNVSVTYVGTADGTACEGFGVVLTAGDEQVQFLKPLDVSEQAQFIFDIDWSPEPSGTPAATLPQPWIDFEVGTSENQMTFCPPSLYDSTGALVGVQDGDSTDLPDWVADSVLPGTQYACVGSRSADIGPAAVSIHDKIFLIGDAKMRL